MLKPRRNLATVATLKVKASGFIDMEATRANLLLHELFGQIGSA
ncbi:hypothetical protein [Marinobacter sp. BSs20148]|nr:hypothetical protein [Marinobacter sp. BSs20148]AFP28993.1 hypothetical protein MRBBS_0055 [Marinobacter sp. BSs20148]